MSVKNEFLPWEQWKNRPENKDLSYNEMMRKYKLERYQHEQRQTFYENQKTVRDSGVDK